jgi:hypothetical protein
MPEQCHSRKITALGWDAHCSQLPGHSGDVHESADFAWQDESEQAWLKCGQRMLGEACYEPLDHEDGHQSVRMIWSSLPFKTGRNVFMRAQRRDLDK